MIKKLKEKLEKLKLENVKEIKIGEADNLPYRDNMFDWVTCIGMLEYYPISYARKVLKEIKRVLKPNGKCFIDIPDSSNKEVLKHSYIYKYNPKEFEKLCKELNFLIIKKNKAGLMIQYLLKSL